MNQFVRVTIRTKSGKTTSFWAQKLQKTSRFTRYRRVDNEGDDYGYYRKDGKMDSRKLPKNGHFPNASKLLPGGK